MADALVVGSGLIGSSILAHHARGGHAERTVVDWDDQAAEQSLAEQARVFAALRDEWTVYWAAGRARADSDEDTVARESRLFRSMLVALCDMSIRRRGSVVLVSSGGGIQAKDRSAGPLEFQRVTPYAVAKLHQERLLSDFVAETGHFGAVARVTNVYGYRPDGRPGSGLTGVLCRAALLGETCDITVPLETTRNYVFARDVGSIMVDVVAAHGPAAPSQLASFLVAGPTDHSIREHIALVERLTGRTVRYRATVDESAGETPRADTHLGAFVPQETRGRTSFEQGIRETLMHAFGFSAGGG